MHRSLILATTLLIGCKSDQGFTENFGAGAGDGPMIEVEPLLLDFGVVADEALVQEFIIRSVGNTDLEVSGIELSGQASGSYTVLSAETAFVLPPGTEQTIEVAFEPIGANQQSAQAIVSSNDELQPKVPVTLQGEGAIPELDISPDPLDFGNTYVGCSKDNWLTLTNVGTDDLEIYTIDHTGGEFVMTHNIPLPITLAPGESESVFMEFFPELEEQAEGELVVTSSEPLGTRIATQTGSGKYAAEYTDEWDHPANSPSDIMFFVDQSCSMDTHSSALANNFATFITTLNNYSTDWQIAVVNDDNGCNRSGILTPSVSGYVGDFQSAVGSGGNWYTESLFTIAQLAVDQTDNGECNSGMMRSEAMLHLVFVSDEEEQSSGSWSNYINTIITKKGNADNVRVSAIVIDNNNSCASESNYYGSRYLEAANSTGGVTLEICSNWATGNNLELLAEASVIQNTYELENEAIEETIVVEVNGSEVAWGVWYYDASSNAVVFDSNPPQEGDSIEISYASPATCD